MQKYVQNWYWLSNGNTGKKDEEKKIELHILILYFNVQMKDVI